jgi:hypothetical protein
VEDLTKIYERKYSKGNYDTDFSNLSPGKIFPSSEVRDRNRVYRWNKKLFSGEYAFNKKLIAIIDEVQTEINYSTIPINKFELVVNKLDSLLFGNELTIQTGDVNRDREVQRLVEKTHWVRDIRRGVKLAEIYGDAVLKTGRYGVSSFSPLFAYKVLDISDKNRVVGYVLHELLYDKQEDVNRLTFYNPKFIRIVVSCKGYEYERVFEYKGSNLSGVLGNPVRYKYKDRWISKKGNYYWTGIDDCETVQWLSVNTEKDGVYGASAFDSLKDIVFAIENRLSTENWVIDNHGKPILLVGMTSVVPNEKTGTYSPSIIEGKYMIQKGQGEKPEYLTWDGKLENSKQLRDDLMEQFYELSEMGKTFLSGQYTGNVSEESLNNMIKSAIDRGQRDLNDLWYDIRKSLYVLCKLNNIDVQIEDININFNVGRVDDTKVISEICETLSGIGLFSKQTLLSKFFGYTEEDALAEFERIQSENTNI